MFIEQKRLAVWQQWWMPFPEGLLVGYVTSLEDLMLPSSTHAQGSSLKALISAKFGALMSSQIGGLSLFAATVILLQVSSIGCPIKVHYRNVMSRLWSYARMGIGFIFEHWRRGAVSSFLLGCSACFSCARCLEKEKQNQHEWRIAFGMIAFCFIALWALRLGYDGDFSMILPVTSGDYLADIVSWQVPRWWEFVTRLF